MGLFRPDRSRRSEDDPFLLWKVRLFVLGGGLGIAGMITEWGPLLWGGIAALAAGVALRFGGRNAENHDDGWGAEAED